MSAAQDWAPRRPADMPAPLAPEDDPVLEAELVVELARRNLQIRKANAKRATVLLARAQLAAAQAREELLDAVKIAQDALWELVEVSQ